MNGFEQLHPALQYHIVNSLGWDSLRPTQCDAIEPIGQGLHCLVLAPTAGGKTEAAVIPLLSRMLTEQWTGQSVLYVCPIKALLNNLEPRLSRYAGLVGRRVTVWHGDVSQAGKRRALKDPPDILLTTPESLEGMLVSTRIERQPWFENLRAVIVDELHSFAGDDRGWHLRSVLSRLDRYTPQPLQRIGLSATVSNPEELLNWLAPKGERRVVGTSHVGTDAEVTVDWVETLENAALVVSSLHRGEKRLVFCDSRGNVERLASLLREHGVRTFISHASLSAAERRQAETAFGEERDCVIVATSTLELGIDVGDLDRVIQLDAPTTVSSFLQRMGRSGRRAAAKRNCLFLCTQPSSLLSVLGLVELWSRGWVEAVSAPPEPWGVVAQQSLTLILERGMLATGELLSYLKSAFPECSDPDVKCTVEFLLGTGYLSQPAEGMVQIGPRAETQFGRGHYRELLATFSGVDLLLARYGRTDVGYIDPSVLALERSGDQSPDRDGQSSGPRILLAGRSWRCVEVDWKRRVVQLEPVASGGKARWSGGSRVIGASVCGAIRDVLERGELPGARLSKRALNKLGALREEIPITPHSITQDEPGGFRVWTFAGTLANRALAVTLKPLVGVRGLDELGIDTISDPRVLGDLRRLTSEAAVVDDAELKRYRQAIKFADCVPEALLRREVNRRMLGILVAP